MDRRYSTLLVLAIAALFAEACSSSSTKSGTGGAGGGSSMGGATGTGGKAATGGMTGSMGGMTASMGGMTGAGGKIDGGADTTTSTGGATGTDAGDASSDTPAISDSGADADPAASEKAMCLTTMFMSNITTQPFTADQFCTLYFSECNDLQGVTHFATQADCRTAYNGYNMTPDADMSPTGQQGCRSYHLCNAVRLNVNPHCAHATGLGGFDAGPGQPCL